MQPDFGQAHAKLACETSHCCLRARFGSCSGFLSPPAPRGADGPGHSFVSTVLCGCNSSLLSFRPALRRPFSFGSEVGCKGFKSEIRGQKFGLTRDGPRIPSSDIRHLISVKAAPRMMPGLSWLPSCTMTAAASTPSALICAIGTFQFDWAPVSVPSLSQLRTTLW